MVMFLYFLLAFGLAWTCQLPVYVGGLGGPLSLALLAVGGIAPTLAALIVTRGALWRETWRGPRPAWALALGLSGPSVLVAVAGLASGTLELSAPNLPAVLVPPLGEELGWRGFLLSRWRARRGPVVASLAVGVVWALWHLPTAWESPESFPAFAAILIAGSVVMGWLWEASGRSILVAVALHAGINLGAVHANNSVTLVAWVLAASLAAVQMSRRAHTPSKP